MRNILAYNFLIVALVIGSAVYFNMPSLLFLLAIPMIAAAAMGCIYALAAALAKNINRNLLKYAKKPEGFGNEQFGK